jgi:hypothetical protein
MASLLQPGGVLSGGIDVLSSNAAQLSELMQQVGILMHSTAGYHNVCFLVITTS